MVETLKVILIDDCIEDIQKIKKNFDDTVTRLKKWGFLEEMGFQKIQMLEIQGDGPKEVSREKEHQFYTEKVIGKIRKELSEQDEDMRTGILLDVILTKEEQKQADVNDFSDLKLAKLIYDTFEKECPIHVITSLRSFGSLAWGIFGRENFSDYYINKQLVYGYRSYKAMAKALYRLCNKDEMPEGLEARIEKKELS